MSINFNVGHIAALAKTREALDELLSEGKSVLSIIDGKYIFYPECEEILPSEKARERLSELAQFDVLEFYDADSFSVFYRDDSQDNAVVMTNKCNSNCIMCPCSELYRQAECLESAEHICSIIDHLPSDVRFMTITGGEPSLQKDGLIKVLSHFKEKLPNTDYFLLTNGRTFSNKAYVERVLENAPENIRYAIPLYGYSPETHDSITRADGSFRQTVSGLKTLIKHKCDIEIRIVVTAMNAPYLDKVAKYISANLSGVNRVHFIAQEMMGTAARNRDTVWIDYDKSFECCKNAIRILVSAGINVRLYNFPLCKVERGYWSMCEKSISDYKIRYGDSCEDCSVKDQCGGVFRSTLLLTKMHLEPVKEV